MTSLAEQDLVRALDKILDTQLVIRSVLSRQNASDAVFRTNILYKDTPRPGIHHYQIEGQHARRLLCSYDIRPLADVVGMWDSMKTTSSVHRRWFQHKPCVHVLIVGQEFLELDSAHPLLQIYHGMVLQLLGDHPGTPANLFDRYKIYANQNRQALAASLLGET